LKSNSINFSIKISSNTGRIEVDKLFSPDVEMVWKGIEGIIEIPATVNLFYAFTQNTKLVAE